MKRAASVLAALLLALPTSACERRGETARASSLQVTRERTVAGLRVLTIFANGADDASPLIVGMHGRGGSPSIVAARATITAFKEDGGLAELHEFAGVGHTITTAMREDAWAHMLGALDAPRVDGRGR